GYERLKPTHGLTQRIRQLLVGDVPETSLGNKFAGEQRLEETLVGKGYLLGRSVDVSYWDKSLV
ncbi:hypothetical protein A2U01_0047186, partial [Trifolium medium]|nr:hypothetical protein [Trifolium medium]